MALNVKHLNSDASFLLTLEPVAPTSAVSPNWRPQPFYILLDPWITGSSQVLHSKISSATHKKRPCISSLRQLPEPNLVIISQNKSVHCHEATFRQLPPRGTKTVILAEARSAKTIRGWKHFDKNKVHAIPKWEDPRTTGRSSVVRISVPPTVPNGDPGEVTVAFVRQKRDLASPYYAIGITYRPPPTKFVAGAPAARKIFGAPSALNLTLPPTPRSHHHASPSQLPSTHIPGILPHCCTDDLTVAPMSALPGLVSLRSCRSASNFEPSATSANHNVCSRLHMSSSAATRPTSSFMPDTTPSPTNPESPTYIRPQTARPVRSTSARKSSGGPTVHSAERTLSVIFAPHGISYSSLRAYATEHLVTEAALPLTALLHCLDTVTLPWWMGGNVLLGAAAGAEIAARLGARVWISAHDGDKDVQGLAAGFIKTKRCRPDEVEGTLVRNASYVDASLTKGGGTSMIGGGNGIGIDTEVLALATGEEVVLTREGVWDTDEGAEVENKLVEADSNSVAENHDCLICSEGVVTATANEDPPVSEEAEDDPQEVTMTPQPLRILVPQTESTPGAFVPEEEEHKSPIKRRTGLFTKSQSQSPPQRQSSPRHKRSIAHRIAISPLPLGALQQPEQHQEFDLHKTCRPLVVFVEHDLHGGNSTEMQDSPAKQRRQRRRLSSVYEVGESEDDDCKRGGARFEHDEGISPPTRLRFHSS